MIDKKPIEPCVFRRLRSVKLGCIDCDTSHVVLRPAPPQLWEDIDRASRLPAVHVSYCTNCCKEMDHFVDWPS